MQQKLITIFLIIVSLCAGIFIGTKIAYTTAPEKSVDSTYSAGWAAAIKALYGNEIAPPLPGGMELKNFTGTIQSISGNTLTVKVNSPLLMSTPELVTRTVLVNSNTKISQLSLRDPLQVQKEFDAFNEKIKKQANLPPTNPGDMPIPPQTQESKAATITDFKESQIIEINAAEDIQNKQEFTATEIQILSTNFNLGGQTPPPDRLNEKPLASTTPPIPPAVQ